MKRVALEVAYDGTDYCGWQIQKNAKTVEYVLTEALRRLLQEDVELTGASRTDSGVHAMGNIAVFDTETQIPPDRMSMAVNRYLPEDIRVMRSWETAPDFHPRHCVSRKTYEYTIMNTSIPLPVLRRYTYHVYGALDVAAMEQAAGILVGTHDFSAFCSAGSQVKSKVRTIYELNIKERYVWPAAPSMGTDGRLLGICVSGNGFLYNMVRILAGTLIEVGLSRRSLDSVAEALAGGRRELAGPTAPAAGLTLCSICFEQGGDG